MRVVAIQHVWNEIEYLPLKIKWCERNNIEPYVIDNMSDDGSWEWLQENNIPSHRLDTNGSFWLKPLLNETQKTVHKIKPDWVIFMGCDEFFVAQDSIIDTLKKYNKQGIELIKIEGVALCNTGEDMTDFDPINTFFYSVRKVPKPGHIQTRIFKYTPKVIFTNDNVKVPNAKIAKLDGCFFNYGNAKPASQREATLRRREKAWKEGMHRNLGCHLRVYSKRNWLWEKEKTWDIRKQKYGPFIEKLQKLMSDDGD